MRLRSFIRNQQGSVLITTGLGILFLVGVAGAAIDLGQQQLIRARLQQSSDAAALAAGTFTLQGVNPEQVAKRYFDLNYSDSYMGLSTPSPQIATGDTISVQATSTRSTTFVRGIGAQSTASGGRTVVLTNPTYKPRKYDLVLVMDNTLSMRAMDVGVGTPQSRIDGLTYAAKVIAKNLLDDASASGSRVGAVSWYTSVDPGQVLPLTTSLSTVNGFLDSRYLKCCTDSSVGLEAAQDQIVPQFRDDAVHAIVLLTDGLNNSHGGGLGGGGGPAANAASEEVCTAMKQKGVLIYAVGYGKAASNTESSVAQFLARCATQNPNGGSNKDLYYFIAPDTSVLDKVFGSILESIKKVRLSE